MQQRLLLIFAEAIGRHHLDEMDVVERPAMTFGHRDKLDLRLRKGDVDTRLASAGAVQQEAET